MQPWGLGRQLPPHLGERAGEGSRSVRDPGSCHTSPDHPPLRKSNCSAHEGSCFRVAASVSQLVQTEACLPDICDGWRAKCQTPQQVLQAKALWLLASTHMKAVLWWSCAQGFSRPNVIRLTCLKGWTCYVLFLLHVGVNVVLLTPQGQQAPQAGKNDCSPFSQVV